MKSFALLLVLSAPLAAAAVIGDDEIRRILTERIDARKQAVGIVAGVIDPAGRRVIAHGKLAAGDTRTPDGDTVFEIGSVTKVFTALLLADMVARGEVALDDPVSKYLPQEVRMPRRGGRDITLQDLATHTSGLPRLPSPFTPKNPANPYADYSVEDLYRFLSSHELRRDIGSQYEYSNLGGGLLGHVLARRAGMDYESLVRARITGPLGMNDTRIALTPQMQSRLASGHNERLAPVANWDLPTLAGAGALRSTVNDLLKFVAVPLGDSNRPLAKAMSAMLAVRRPTGAPTLEIALGWHVAKRGGREIIWHNGGTGGYGEGDQVLPEGRGRSDRLRGGRSERPCDRPGSAPGRTAHQRQADRVITIRPPARPSGDPIRRGRFRSPADPRWRRADRRRLVAAADRA